MPSQEKVAFGAIVHHQTHRMHADTDDHLTPRNVFDTPRDLSPSNTRDDLESSLPIMSEAGQKHYSVSSVKNEHNVFETDLESGISPYTPNASASRLDLPSPFQYFAANGSKYSVNSAAQECAMWPSKHTLQEKARQEKAKRSGTDCCAPITQRWASMDKRQRLWFKIFIALLIVAFAVGLGIGISRAVGGGIWSTGNQINPIAGSD